MNYSLFALGLGFLLGLKHATEADHLVAVTTIVSEQRSVSRSALVGAMWGVGHTAALLAAGVVVILLEVTIPERVAEALEFGVALMIVSLGSRVLYLALRRRRRVHVHAHTHGGHTHTHLHFHENGDEHSADAGRAPSHERHGGFGGWRPFVVGLVHGLAGSAALTLLVLTEVLRNGSLARPRLPAYLRRRLNRRDDADERPHQPALRLHRVALHARGRARPPAHRTRERRLRLPLRL